MKHILFPLFFLAFSVSVTAQREERIKSMKIAFITDAIDLTTQEAQAFWPVYNIYDDQITAIRKKERDMVGEARQGFEKITDEDAGMYLKQMIANKKEMNALETAMMEELQTVIPAKKVMRLIQAEHGFRRRMLERLRGGPRGPRGNRNGRN